MKHIFETYQHIWNYSRGKYLYKLNNNFRKAISILAGFVFFFIYFPDKNLRNKVTTT